jgi:hypothetical protein
MWFLFFLFIILTIDYYYKIIVGIYFKCLCIIFQGLILINNFHVNYKYKNSELFDNKFNKIFLHLIIECLYSDCTKHNIKHQIQSTSVLNLAQVLCYKLNKYNIKSQNNIVILLPIIRQTKVDFYVYC